MSLHDDPEWRAIKKDTHKQFIQNILLGKSATEAYALSFPNSNRSTAAQKGHQLKNKYSDLIARQSYIPSIAIERVANKTLENLMLLAFADIGDMVDANGVPKPIHDIPKPLRMAITEVEIDGDRVKYKVTGRTKALELLAKITKIDNPQPQIEINMISEEERKQKLMQILTVAANRTATNDKGEE